jgi:hypothetical protein
MGQRWDTEQEWPSQRAAPQDPQVIDMTDPPLVNPSAPTVWSRMLAAGISPPRIERHLAAGRVIVDGVRVTDPDTPAAPPARIVLLEP